jgi:hypothetical protein
MAGVPCSSEDDCSLAANRLNHSRCQHGELAGRAASFCPSTAGQLGVSVQVCVRLGTVATTGTREAAADVAAPAVWAGGTVLEDGLCVLGELEVTEGSVVAAEVTVTVSAVADTVTVVEPPLPVNAAEDSPPVD